MKTNAQGERIVRCPQCGGAAGTLNDSLAQAPRSI